MTAVVDENGIWGGVRRLQSGSHFAGMERIAVAVSVAGNDHDRGIRHAVVNLVIRRILCERGEIFRIINGAEFLFPYVSVVEKVIAQHVQHGNHADNGAEEIGTLR